jgi:hypothetical protein
LEYRFDLADIPPKITAEGKIDWRFNPTRNPEWVWKLNRHQWWPILGLAYVQTGDEQYSTAFVNQMLDWATNNLPPPRMDENSPTWRLMETALRMRISWIPSFALFYESPVFTAEAKLVMLKSIFDHASFLSLFKSNRNHFVRESNGLAYVSVYFPEFKEAQHWQQIALSRLDQELSTQINQDGSHIELSTGYQWLIVNEFEQTYHLLQAHNLSLPHKNLAIWLEKMYQVLAHLVRPDGTYPEINDGFLHWSSSHLAQAGKMLGCADLLYVGTAGRQGSPPSHTSIGFNDAGLYVMRSDWSAQARYLLFDAGPYGGPHGHEDKLSVELYAFGQSFIVDPGSYTYDKTDPFRPYFVSSQSHNTVLVDGQSQVRRWQKESLDPKPAIGNYAAWISQPDFDYVRATYADGYGFFQFKQPKDAPVIKDVSHTRHILFVKPDYWLMIDELQASNPHHYQLLFHTPPEIRAVAGSAKTVILKTSSDGPSLYLIPAEHNRVQVNWLFGSENPIQGWYSADYHTKTPATAIIYEYEAGTSIVLATLLYPCPAGQAAEDVTIEPLPVSGGEGLAYVVTTQRGKDYLMISQDDNLKEFGPYQSRGPVAGICTDSSGTVLRQFCKS